MNVSDLPKALLAPHRSPRRMLASVVLGLLLVGALVLFMRTRPPQAFPAGAYIEVPVGASAYAIGDLFERDHVIRSAFLFKVWLRLSHEDHGIPSGIYVFSQPLPLTAVAARLTAGDYGTEETHVTFPEGIASYEMAEIIREKAPVFDAAAFEALAKGKEGYLFPDTYYVLPGESPETLVSQMSDTFAATQASLQPEIDHFGKPLPEVVTMASILEKEGKTDRDRRIIAGILWKRLSLGMRLQVDAPFGYLHQESGYVPTAADLASGSPYNTYRTTGLPPGPIGNPGKEALEAAVTPIATDYLYYLSGPDGTIHYAKTLDEHAENRQKYLGS